MESHIQDTALLGKPLVLEEFGAALPLRSHSVCTALDCAERHLAGLGSS